jgi:hypothetical protein
MPRLNAFTNKILVGKGLRRRVSVTVTLATNITNYLLDPTSVSANGLYIAGQTDVTLVVNSGVYVYSNTYLVAGLAVGAFNSGDTVSIINNGYIIGMGGGQGGADGSNAINVNYPVTITNNSYIAGGGGAGAVCGGGGAGGGVGVSTNATRSPGGAGGGPGSAGSVGSASSAGGVVSTSGGGGGRILPGTGGSGCGTIGGGGQVNAVFAAFPGGGGGAGAGGGAMFVAVGRYANHTATGANGGGSNSTGSNGAGGGSGAGGHSWGASGGSGVSQGVTVAGSTGGKAVNLNGYAVTWVATGTRYGAIS